MTLMQTIGSPQLNDAGPQSTNIMSALLMAVAESHPGWGFWLVFVADIAVALCIVIYLGTGDPAWRSGHSFDFEDYA